MNKDEDGIPVAVKLLWAISEGIEEARSKNTKMETWRRDGRDTNKRDWNETQMREMSAGDSKKGDNLTTRLPLFLWTLVPLAGSRHLPSELSAVPAQGGFPTTEHPPRIIWRDGAFDGGVQGFRRWRDKGKPYFPTHSMPETEISSIPKPPTVIGLGNFNNRASSP